MKIVIQPGSGWIPSGNDSGVEQSGAWEGHQL
jgi:hypothetical protein